MLSLNVYFWNDTCIKYKMQKMANNTCILYHWQIQNGVTVPLCLFWIINGCKIRVWWNCGATVKTCKVSHMLYRGDTVIYCHQFGFVCKIKNFMHYLGRNIVSKAGLRLPISEDSVSRELEAWDTICKAKANWWFIVYLNFFNFCFSNTHNEFIYVQVCQNQIHFALIIASFFDWLHVFG